MPAIDDDDASSRLSYEDDGGGGFGGDVAGHVLPILFVVARA